MPHAPGGTGRQARYRRPVRPQYQPGYFALDQLGWEPDVNGGEFLPVLQDDGSRCVHTGNSRVKGVWVRRIDFQMGRCSP